MHSRVVRLAIEDDGRWDRGSSVDGRAPDAVLALLPAGEPARELIARLARRWPGAVRFGCEAVTQFAESGLTSNGVLQLFWFDRPGTSVEVSVIEAGANRRVGAGSLDDAARRIRLADAVQLIADGIRFPVREVLDGLRERITGCAVPIAGGLASAPSDGEAGGAHVFVGDRLVRAGCLVVTWTGVRSKVEIVRGWSPASPVYTVTRAEGSTVFEIDGEPATEWYRRFFTVGGELAPLPEAAHRFPLLVVGPSRERQGVYRSMREFDSPEGAVTFWGDLAVGDEVRLGMGNEVSLVETARELAAVGRADAAMLYSCVGREVVLGARAEDEVEAIHDALDGVPLSGFFTFGEIGPTAAAPMAFYNHTAVLVLLDEPTR